MIPSTFAVHSHPKLGSVISARSAFISCRKYRNYISSCLSHRIDTLLWSNQNIFLQESLLDFLFIPPLPYFGPFFIFIAWACFVAVFALKESIPEVFAEIPQMPTNLFRHFKIYNWRVINKESTNQFERHESTSP